MEKSDSFVQSNSKNGGVSKMGDAETLRYKIAIAKKYRDLLIQFLVK